MESQGSCIRNELFTKKIKKVEKKRGKSDSLSEGGVGGSGGGGTGRKRDSVGALRYTLVTYW